ncbi:phosphoglycerate kinase [Candidatus Binatia bacterium]|nr:phosphoglycerate kinase [Candidatus Binatia bacterium]
MKIIDQVDLDGKRTFIRVDFNVPLEDEGGVRRISDDSRVRGALPTIRYAVEHGARVVLASHLGRPKGKVDPRESLAPAAKRLGELLGKPVALASDCIGTDVEQQVGALGKGDILMLENLRFHTGEEKNDPAFAASLAKLADVYVNDAFGAAHRAHASTAGMAALVPVRAAGFLLRDELKHLGALLDSPARPFVAILGGAKVSDKISVIDNLLPRIDALLIGGAMAYTFLKAQGIAVGGSRVEADKVDLARTTLEQARAKGVRLLLPEDHVIATKPEAGADSKTTSDPAIPDGWLGVDIGPRTRATYAAEIARAKTVLWNGPMGIFEIEAYAGGTVAVAHAVADARQAFTVVGGGDSVAAVTQAGVADRIGHISTGGGASLEFLEGQTLPGVAALEG